MKRLEIVGPGKVGTFDRAEPMPGPDQVLIRTQTVGICHSDVELLNGKFITDFSYPIVPGHEWVGVVEAVGPGVSRLALGDRVVGLCRVGDNHYFGLNIDGAAAERFAVDADWLFQVPAEMSSASGALVEPFTVAYYAIDVHGPLPGGDTVVVLGAGAIGLSCIAAVVAMGGVAIAVDPSPERRELAGRLGAIAALDPTDQLQESVLAMTEGRGADLVLEASGAAAALASALQLVRQFGRITYVGFNIGEQVTCELGLIQSKDLSVKGITGSGDVWERAIALLAEKDIDLTPLVTATFTLDDAQQAFERVAQGRDIKVQLTVT